MPRTAVCTGHWPRLFQSLLRTCGVLTLAWGLQSTALAQILIGQTAGVTGIVASGVQESTLGAKLYIDSVNAKGGVAGQAIELVSLDDQFDPKLAVENTSRLIEERHVVAMFLTRGTPHTEAIIPLLDQFGVPLVGPSTGTMVLHQPVRKHVFNVRATYQREAEKAVGYLNLVGVNRIALLHVDDSFGNDGMVGAQHGLAEAKLSPVAVEKFDRVKPDFSGLAARIAATDAQAVMLIASGTSAVQAVQALRQAGSAAQIVTLSNNASAGFVKSLGAQARGVVVTQVFPYERSIAFPFVREAQDLAKAKGMTEVSPSMLEGFAAAKVLVEGLRRAGPKITRERLQQALEGLRKFDLGGLEVTYGPDDHTGLDFADLSIIGPDGKFRR